MVDIPGDRSTTASIGVGGTVSGVLETVGDHDWYRISLTAGQPISVLLDGIGLEDSYLRIRDASGNILFENDDIASGVIRDSSIAFDPSYTGTYFIDVGSFEDKYSGDYKLSVQPYTPPPLWSLDQIAGQLVNGYWGGDAHHFAVKQGGTITVDLSGLSAPGQKLAKEALALWSDVIGVTFKQVVTGAQITFDDDEAGAFADGVWSGGITTSAHVNVSVDWLTDYGASLDGYAFQTFVHEIGHALGLGHAGNYNGDARYPFDALFLNDSWSTTVMSYFSQRDSSYFSGKGFSEAFVVTPMLADIIAMSTLYGLSTTTRTGDTTYGFNSNAGRDIFNASLFPKVAYTVFDSGGTDTLDFSAFGGAQRIDLNQESYSNVLGLTGNVSIARGTVIENAVGGRGDDTIIGTAASNRLTGGVGEDTVSYETASAAVRIDLRSGSQQDTLGAGRDTLSGFENLSGSAFGDTLIGGSTTATIHGGSGDDRIFGTTSARQLSYGDDGDDTFYSSSGADFFDGGRGFDTVDYSRASTGVRVSTERSYNDAGALGRDSLGDIERVIGSAYDDSLSAFGTGHVLVGGAGDDSLTGNGMFASQLIGGLGNDVFYVGGVVNRAIEAANEGTDQVRALTHYTLGANIENLVLLQPFYDPYAGATPSGPPFADFDGKGNSLANTLTGNDGANRLYGLDGDDRLSGGSGNDRLDGGSGVDRLYGGVGDDRYIVTDLTDYAYERAGEGNDRVYSSVSLTLRANLEALYLTGTDAIGGRGNDLANLISGNEVANVLRGMVGDDRLYGLGGADVLDGGDGRDWLEGGAGRDRLIGSTGADSFVFRDGDFASAVASGADQIHDFSSRDGDRIRLDLVDADTTSAGNQAFAFLGTAAFTNVAGQLRYEQISGNTYLSGDTDGDGVADFTVRLDGLHALGTNDLVL